MPNEENNSESSDLSDFWYNHWLNYWLNRYYLARRKCGYDNNADLCKVNYGAYILSFKHWLQNKESRLKLSHRIQKLLIEHIVSCSSCQKIFLNDLCYCLDVQTGKYLPDFRIWVKNRKPGDRSMPPNHVQSFINHLETCEYCLGQINEYQFFYFYSNWFKKQFPNYELIYALEKLRNG
ncbi:MAG: hypothetical protein PHV60_00740 [bacterium]|nr:hypothetical protein [bacterium]